MVSLDWRGMPIRTLTQDDLRWLVCPVCHAALRLQAEAIHCKGCARNYPIIDGLPVLLASRVTSRAEA